MLGHAFARRREPHRDESPVPAAPLANHSAARLEDFPRFDSRSRGEGTRTGINRPCSDTKPCGLARQDEVLRMISPMVHLRAGRGRGQLADAAGISKPYLSQIETGKRKGTTDILSALAKALNVTLEKVIAREAELR